QQLYLDEQRARVEAEHVSQMKYEFLATLSHELRTPLNAMLGWSQLLLQGHRDGAMLRRGLETIERNARAQSQLIEDMLDMSRLLAG
ncbi:sensor histidine kinase, partial [Escherichia coli]|uniref:sensor histidine kinase n=1 Tax=Escherichia coli TaxID=562 RepID=UPI002AC85564